MRFGIFDHMEHRRSTLGELYTERLEMLERADQAGFWCYHKAEHHFINLDAAPSSNVFLAAASQRTTHIRFGPLVYLLPFYHPLRLLEEICALDQLSGGRLEVGVGKGISPVEHRFWGLEPEHAKAQFEEALAIVIEGLATGSVGFEGAHYRFDEVDINMRAHDGRVPGFWYAGNAAYAGERRMNTVVSGPISVLAQTAQAYRDALACPRSNCNPGTTEPTFAVKRHVYVAATDEIAQTRISKAYPVYHENLARLWKQYNEPFPNRDPSFGGDMHAAQAAQDLLIGSPDTIAAHIEALVDEVGTDYVIAAFAWGDLAHHETLASLELFVNEVMPRF